MNQHWGYNKNDQDWKSLEYMVRGLADCAGKGGNLLLNVGPTSEGLIPSASIDRLNEIGAWTEANGESIYGTTASPFEELPWGRATLKEGKLYLHVPDWPADGKLFLPLANKPGKVALLNAPDQALPSSSTTGSFYDFKTLALGEIRIPKSGRAAVTIKATKMPGGAVMNLSEIKLAPAR